MRRLLIVPLVVTLALVGRWSTPAPAGTDVPPIAAAELTAVGDLAQWFPAIGFGTAEVSLSGATLTGDPTFEGTGRLLFRGEAVGGDGTIVIVSWAFVVFEGSAQGGADKGEDPPPPVDVTGVAFGGVSGAVLTDSGDVSIAGPVIVSMSEDTPAR